VEGACATETGVLNIRGAGGSGSRGEVPECEGNGGLVEGHDVWRIAVEPRRAHEAQTGVKDASSCMGPPPPCMKMHPRTIDEHVARLFVLALKRQRGRETPAEKRQRVHTTMLTLCVCNACTLAGTRHYIL